MDFCKRVSLFLLFYNLNIVLGCDYFSQLITVKCAGSLVEFFDAKEFHIHPKLHDVEKFCLMYAKYRQCVSVASVRCRATVTNWLENMYDHLCQAEVPELSIQTVAIDAFWERVCVL